jgi:hypothetical protein
MKFIKIASASLLFLVIIFFNSCTSKYEERLDGIWEWVDVVNINAEMTEEWHFIELELTIVRYNKSNPDSTWVYERGTYFLEWNFFGTYINIEGTSINSYNTRWDVIKLSNTDLIITNDIDGGILYKEFIKLDK